jgi:uncharacterized protein (DUF885 family)
MRKARTTWVLGGVAALTVSGAVWGTACERRARPPTVAADENGDGGRGAADLGQTQLPREPRALLDALVQADLEAEMAFSPTLATWLGAVAHGDDRLDDLRAEALAREAGRCRALLDRVRAIDVGRLDSARQIERRLLQKRCEEKLFDLVELRVYERNPIVYVDLLNGAIDELVADGAVVAQPAERADRMKAIASRLWKFRSLLDEARRNLRAGTPQGVSDLAVKRAVELTASLRSFVGETLPRALQPAEAKLHDELRAAEGDASRALDDFGSWLTRDLAPRAKGAEALGAARFAERLRTSEGVTIAPEVLAAAFERALRESKRRHDDLVKQISAAAPPVGIGPNAKGPVDVGRLLEEDHARPEELLAQAETLAQAVLAFVRAQKLAPLDDRAPSPVVREMPPHLWGFVRLVAPRPLQPEKPDKKEPALLFVDGVEREWTDRQKNEHLRALNRTALLVRLAHDLVGHLPIAQAQRKAPGTLAKVAQTPSFVEGYAHYIERALVDAGFAAGDLKLRLQIERVAMLRAARALAAVRYHALGAKLDDLTELFVNDALLDEAQARREAERVAVDPLVLADCLGRLAIEKLRSDWRAAHPDATLGEFHAALLARGALPLPMIRELLLSATEPGPLL